jgi:hypothetical protein
MSIQLVIHVFDVLLSATQHRETNPKHVAAQVIPKYLAEIIMASKSSSTSSSYYYYYFFPWGS